MTERSWFWSGTSVGHAALPQPYGAPYNDEMFTKVISNMILRDNKKQGVIASSSSDTNFDLARTGDALTIDPGWAIVDGKIYQSSSAINFNVSSDGTWSVVLRKSWTNQTVTMSLIQTSSITQVSDSTWDLELYRIVRTGGSIISVKDRRRYVNKAYYKTIPLNWMWGPVEPTTNRPYYPYNQNSKHHWTFNWPSDFLKDLEIHVVVTGGGSNDWGGTIRSLTYYENLDPFSWIKTLFVGDTSWEIGAVNPADEIFVAASDFDQTSILPNKLLRFSMELMFGDYQIPEDVYIVGAYARYVST